MALLLFAAGEKIADATVGIPEYLKPTMSLKDMCRRAIRSHLMELDPKQHLFQRISLLKLPDSLKGYLLHYMSLETEENQGDIGDSKTETEAGVADYKDGEVKAENENLST